MSCLGLIRTLSIVSLEDSREAFANQNFQVGFSWQTRSPGSLSALKLQDPRLLSSDARDQVSGGKRTFKTTAFYYKHLDRINPRVPLRSVQSPFAYFALFGPPSLSPR